MTEQQLDKLYMYVNTAINIVKQDIQYANNQLVFDKENETLKAYTAERNAKLTELKVERIAILKGN